MKTEQQVQDNLHELLETLSCELQFNEEYRIETGLADAKFRTFEEAGIMTNNKGIVIRYANGSEYQLTIVKSR